MRFLHLTIFITLALFVFPTVVFANASDTVALMGIYAERADLHKAFEKKTWHAIPNSAAGFLIDLEDWARQYGWREYPEKLSGFIPSSETLPVKQTRVDVPDLTAEAYIVLDKTSGLILSEHKSTKKWPIASITKLMTTNLVLEQEVAMSKSHAVLASDNVGGARLYLSGPTSYTVQDLMYATLVGSANNAANALSRSTDLSKEAFIRQMNVRASELNLPHTSFVDPTGIELENVSTPREIARLAQYVFSKKEMRRYTSTATKYISSLTDGSQKKLKNTNWMLYKPQFDDIYVMSSKTGFLNESGWNLVVSLRPEIDDEEKEVLIVLFGSDSRADSFYDAERLANWVWRNYEWK